MVLSDHSDLRKLILISWRDRWSEQKWSVCMKKYLSKAGDYLQIADVLVSQSFVGTSPNTTLLGYLWYSLRNGFLPYASVITAISKQEELHKTEGIVGMYHLLLQCVNMLNSTCQVNEDSMVLCISLRQILQWLLRNIELFAKQTQDCFSVPCDQLIQLNCNILNKLTTEQRTSALLTIARFEDSSVWSRIETDLAVIKSSCGQHNMNKDINTSCHNVSLLSRCSLSQRPVYTECALEAPSCLPILLLLRMEVENRKLSDTDCFAQQLNVLSNVCGLGFSDMCFYLVHSCLVCYVDTVGQSIEHEWCAFTLFKLPKVLLSLKDGAYDENGKTADSEEKGEQVFLALKRLMVYYNLLDAVDQFKADMNIIEVYIILC